MAAAAATADQKAVGQDDAALSRHRPSGRGVFENIDIPAVDDSPQGRRVGRDDVLVLLLRSDDIECLRRQHPRVFALARHRYHRHASTLVVSILDIEKRTHDIAANGPEGVVARIGNDAFGTTCHEGFVGLVGNRKDDQFWGCDIRAGGEVGSAGQVAVEAGVDFVPEPVLRYGRSGIRVRDRHAAGMEIADEYAVVMDRHAIETRGKRTVGTHVESRRGVEEEDCHGQRRSECLVPPVVDLRGNAAVRSHPEPTVLVADDAARVLVGGPHLRGVDAPAVQGELVLAADPKAQSFRPVAGARPLADYAA